MKSHGCSALFLAAGLLVAGCSKTPAQDPPRAATHKTKPAPPLRASAKPTTTLDLPGDLDAVTQHSATDDGDDGRQIYRLLRRNLALVNSCYLHARRREPELSGKLTLTMTIGPGPQGLVTKAHVVSRSFNKPRMESCVIGSLRAFTFPRRAKEGLELTVPLLFR